MCESGDYTERGIKGRDGYQTEFVVDDEQYIVRIPDSLSSIGVLAEPLSIVEKALDEAATLQCARLPYINSASEWFSSVQALVAQNSFRMQELTRRNNELSQASGRLQLQIAELSAPDRISKEARRLGYRLPDPGQLHTLALRSRP